MAQRPAIVPDAPSSAADLSEDARARNGNGRRVRVEDSGLGSLSEYYAVRAGVLVTEPIRRGVNGSLAGTTRPVAASAAAIAAVLVLVSLVTGSAAPKAGASLARISISNSVGDIYAVGVDGSGLRKLTPPDRLDAWPSISPGGRRMAFAAISRAQIDKVGNRSDLVVMRIDGSQPRTVAPRPDQPAAIAWSPGGDRLAYKGADRPDPPYDQVLHIVDLATGRVRRVAGSEHGILPAWSRDGRLAYTHVPVIGPIEAVVADRHGKQLWRTRGSVEGWSPDGTKLAVFRNQTILVLDSGGRRVASFRGQWPVSWAPDSRRIAFVRGAPWALWVAPIRGQSPRRIATLRTLQPTTPLWSPDGRQLVYEAEGTFVISADGGRPRLIPNGSGVFAWASNRRLVVWRWAEQELAVIPIAGGRATVLARFSAGTQIRAQLSPDRRIVVIHDAYR